MIIPDSIESALTAVPKPTPGSAKRTRRKRRTPIDPTDACPVCGDYWTVRWRGRWWCVRCDAAALFPEGGAR